MNSKAFNLKPSLPPPLTPLLPSPLLPASPSPYLSSPFSGYSPSPSPLSPLLSYQPPAVQKEEELEGLKDGAQVRLMLWLGPALPELSSRWSDGVPGGALTIFAEIVSCVPC